MRFRRDWSDRVWSPASWVVEQLMEHTEGLIFVLLIFTFLSKKLIAEDLDSPSNGQIHFSIVSGDRDNEFSVDPGLGLVKVKKKLDRERVRHVGFLNLQ